MRAKILIVDDSKTDRLIIRNILNDYELIEASDGREAITFLKEYEDIDLVILDLNMPVMNGFEVLEVLKNNPSFTNSSTIILTNYDETENEIKGLEMGAVDYIRKPLNMQSLRKRIDVHVNIRNIQRSIKNNNQKLEEMVRERTEELIFTRDVTIHALIGLLEVRDIESSNHTKRTQHMVKAISECLSKKPKFKDILTEDYIMELYKTAPLHDIGKVGIPDNILLKPGKLSFEEFEIMKKHTIFGIEALGYNLKAEQHPSFIKTAIEIVENHHEKFDGSGYPNGLKGNDIPLPGRIMAIADAYDAITSKRVYKSAFDHDYALKQIKNDSGKHFDPEIVEAFMEIQDKILEISEKFNPNFKESSCVKSRQEEE
jgi:putative two-component system response regulator